MQQREFLFANFKHHIGVEGSMKYHEFERWCAARALTLASGAEIWDDPLLSILNQYDLADIEYGCFSFCRPESYHLGFTKIGDAGGDPVAIAPQLDSILCFDPCSPKYAMCKVALSSCHFIDALICFVNSGEEWGYKCTDLASIVAAAGGIDCQAFWRNMTGIFESE